jgi:hypothetical protein
MWAFHPNTIRSYGVTTAAIEYIWQAILESERSNRLQFMPDEMLITAAAHASPQPRLDQSGEVGHEPIVKAAISPALSALG